MPAWRRLLSSALVFPLLAACSDDQRAPVGIMWVSGASGAFVGDTISLVVFYQDAAGDPIGRRPLPSVTWTSSQPGVVAIISDSLALALDTGRAVLTAATTSGANYTLSLSFEVIPPWQGRLVWASNVSSGQPVLYERELPGRDIQRLPDFGYPGASHGLPRLNSDGSKVTAQATRQTGPSAPRTIFIIDLIDGAVSAPFDTVPGTQFAAVWMPGDTMLAFLTGAATGWEVFTAKLDGSGWQQRTQLGQSSPPFFDVTPEGTLILPLRPTLDLYETTLSGDTIRRLTDWPGQKAFPSVSPNGAMIAFAGEGGAGVWIVNRDGSDLKQLLPLKRVPISVIGSIPATAGAPAWTPDSRFVLLQWEADPWWIGDVYSVNSELYAIRVADGLAIRLTRSPSVDASPVFR